MISSVYSKSPPIGIPLAILVTFIPKGLINFDKYIAVASPSTLGLVANIISFTLPSCNLVNSSFIPTKYFDIIRKNIETVNLTDAEFLNYKYQPKKFCYDRYGTTELWGILLRLNSMTSLSDFASQSFRAPKANIMILLNEMLILEKRNIEKNNESIG